MGNKCKICKSEKVSFFATIKGYDLMKCLECGFIYIPSIGQKDIENFYEKDYFDGKLARFSAGLLDQVLPQEKTWIINMYLSSPSYRNILEIGPGTTGGMVKYYFNQPNRYIECVEISKFASDYLNKHGISTFNGLIQNFKPKKRFDLIIATEVIEHDLNPCGFVNSVYRLLNDNGLFFLSTGNTSSFMAKYSGMKWYYYDPPAHISYFNNKNIKLLLLKNGFSKVEIINVGFKWIKLLSKYKISTVISLIGKLNLATGMLVFAKK